MKLASNNLKKQINSKIKNMDIDLKYEKKKLEINSDKIVVSINEIKNNPIFKELFMSKNILTFFYLKFKNML